MNNCQKIYSLISYFGSFTDAHSSLVLWILLSTHIIELRYTTTLISLYMQQSSDSAFCVHRVCVLWNSSWVKSSFLSYGMICSPWRYCRLSRVQQRLSCPQRTAFHFERSTCTTKYTAAQAKYLRTSKSNFNSLGPGCCTKCSIIWHMPS